MDKLSKVDLKIIRNYADAGDDRPEITGPDLTLV